MPGKRRAGKVKDKWREKRWVSVFPSPGFEQNQIAYIPISSDQHAIGKTIETTLFDITRQDPQQNMLIKLHFQIAGIQGNTAATILKGEEYSREYLRSLIRRGASMVNFIKDHKTKDNAVVRVYVVAFTIGRINSSKKHQIRLASDEVISRKARSLTYEQFAQESVKQFIARELYEHSKGIAKVRHIGVRKIKLIKSGVGMPTLPTPPEPEEESDEGEDIGKGEAPVVAPQPIAA
jgi:small subunit ribosomal protein S3Ae